MNIQDILHKGGTRLDAVIDNSEFYDFQLVRIDNEINHGDIDLILDYSEFYDYALGDNSIDYIYRGAYVGECKYLLTEDNYVFSTHDKFLLLYH
jgi:hypothetical protein